MGDGAMAIGSCFDVLCFAGKAGKLSFEASERLENPQETQTGKG